MIWLFRVNEVFWNDNPKVSDYYTFDTNDVKFDITQYDISLYLAIADYYLLSELNDKEIYVLRLASINGNPVRMLIPEKSQIYDIIREFYKNIKRDTKLNELFR